MSEKVELIQGEGNFSISKGRQILPCIVAVAATGHLLSFLSRAKNTRARYTPLDSTACTAADAFFSAAAHATGGLSLASKGVRFPARALADI